MAEHEEPIEEATPAAQPERKHARRTVVGIGASAGGLNALRHFVAGIPADSGLSFVVVVHLAPEKESHLADLLQARASIPVGQVTEPTPLEPNQIYVIPPGRNLSAVDTHLRLSELEAHRSGRAPIDHFFRTLATMHDGHAIGVILSGSGSDGSQGIRHIRERGGLVIVQDPGEAEYDGMPRSAIDTGQTDLVLPIDQMHRHILEFAATQPRVPLAEEDRKIDRQNWELLQKVMTQVRLRTGHDFLRYKRSTIARRVARRMQILNVEQLADYLEIVRESGQEAVALLDDLLINVTSFFRDPEVFDALEKDVVPRLFAGKGPNDRVRVWSVGCATGEEAYSLGMLLLETAARLERPPQVQVFASDLHERSLRYAREALYPDTIAADLTPTRLERFFEKENSGYRVRKQLRDTVVFAMHNLLRDPPFSKIDLIACRNVLIYLQREVQEDVVELFHYALLPSGYLLLGTAETLDRSSLFRLESKEHHLYQRREVARGELRLPALPLSHAPTLQRAMPEPRRLEPGAAYGEFHQKMVERYAPPSLLVNADQQVVHLSEQAGRYLQHPGGIPTNNLFKLVREEFRMELRTALHLARERQQPWRSPPIPVRIEGEMRQVVLRVSRLGQEELDGFALVIFDEVEKTPAITGTEPLSSDTAVAELERELELTRSRLQAVIEEFETSQEEMRAANEELQSSNEELRSTLEELETSKEELQSVNEELQTLNQENRHKVEELSQLSSDLQNLFQATDVATLFLDRSLRILRFTPRVSEIFNVRHSDRGRPLADLTHHLGYDGLIDDAQRVLHSLVPVEREVRNPVTGAYYALRVAPYRTMDDRIEGVVITLVDVTPIKRSEAALRESEERLRLALDVSGMGTFLWNVQEDRTEADARALAHFRFPSDSRFSLAEATAKALDPEDSPAFAQAVQRAISPGGNGRLREEVRVRLPDGSRRWLAVTGQTSFDGDPPRPTRMAGTVLDITERKQSEEQLHRQMDELARFNRAAVGRELRMVELKKEINALLARLGEPASYRVEFGDPATEPGGEAT